MTCSSAASTASRATSWPSRAARRAGAGWCSPGAGVPRSGRELRFVGEVDGDEKARWLAGARVLWMPALWDEPFGLTLVEALVSGTPVLGTNRGAVAGGHLPRGRGPGRYRGRTGRRPAQPWRRRSGGMPDAGAEIFLPPSHGGGVRPVLPPLHLHRHLAPRSSRRIVVPAHLSRLTSYFSPLTSHFSRPPARPVPTRTPPAPAPPPGSP